MGKSKPESPRLSHPLPHSLNSIHRPDGELVEGLLARGALLQVKSSEGAARGKKREEG